MNPRRKRNKTAKNITNKQKSEIVQMFLEFLDAIKLYHWKTVSYSQHKATDELHEKLSKSIDSFMEVLLGKTKRIQMFHRQIRLYDFHSVGPLKEKIFEFREYLVDLSHMLDKKDSDLLSIRDDMLGHVNQFLYLLTLE
jgi:hypothetical protein